MTRFLFLIAFFLTVVCSSAQELSTPPLFNLACQMDSNCAVYMKHHIRMQVDSHFLKGQLKIVIFSHYNDSGQIVLKDERYTEEVETRYTTEYTYNDSGICVYGRKTQIRGADTLILITKRAIVDDTAHGYFSYEIKGRIMHAVPGDSIHDDLVWRYVDTKSKNRWKLWHANRFVIETHCRGHNLPGTSTIYEFRDTDTLQITKIKDDGPGGYSIDTTYSIVNATTRARTVTTRGRLVETMTWTEGKLTEHHVYVDSVSGKRIVRTHIYNKLDSSSQPELVIEYLDSITIVKKNGIHLYEDHHPKPVLCAEPSAVVPPEFPVLQDYFPYHKQVKLDSGHVRDEYYNFYTGTIKPILIEWKDERGIVYRMQDGDWITTRHVE